MQVRFLLRVLKVQKAIEGTNTPQDSGSPLREEALSHVGPCGTERQYGPQVYFCKGAFLIF
jgi:hypothetical protein